LFLEWGTLDKRSTSHVPTSLANDNMHVRLRILEFRLEPVYKVSFCGCQCKRWAPSTLPPPAALLCNNFKACSDTAPAL